MARKTVRLSHADNGRTISVRVGRKVEHVSTECRSKAEIFDQVKYAIIAQGVYLRDPDVIELMQRDL